MGKGYRQGRLAEEIRKVVSGLLLRDIKDPRLIGRVTVTAVEVTADGSLAKIFLTAFDPEHQENQDFQQEVLMALQHSKGYMRRELGSQISVRHVPDLVFRFDTSAEYGNRIEKLLNELGNSNETE